MRRFLPRIPWKPVSEYFDYCCWSLYWIFYESAKCWGENWRNSVDDSVSFSSTQESKFHQPIYLLAGQQNQSKYSRRGQEEVFQLLYFQSHSFSLSMCNPRFASFFLHVIFVDWAQLTFLHFPITHWYDILPSFLETGNHSMIHYSRVICSQKTTSLVCLSCSLFPVMFRVMQHSMHDNIISVTQT